MPFLGCGSSPVPLDLRGNRGQAGKVLRGSRQKGSGTFTEIKGESRLGEEEWGRVARQIAQTCPCRAVAPPSGGTQRDFGGKNTRQSKAQKKLRTAPSGGSPRNYCCPLPRAKKKGMEACWAFLKASGCTKCGETTPNSSLVLAEKRTHEVHTLFWGEGCIR